MKLDHKDFAGRGLAAAAEAKPERDWKRSVLIAGLGLLSWVATYVGMLESGKIDGRDTGAERRSDRVDVVIPGRHYGTAGDERLGGRTAAAAEAEDRDALAGEAGDRDHPLIT